MTDEQEKSVEETARHLAHAICSHFNYVTDGQKRAVAKLCLNALSQERAKRKEAEKDLKNYKDFHTYVHQCISETGVYRP